MAAGWEPVTVFHGVLAEPAGRDEAEEVVRRDGLPGLGDPWWLEEAPGRWAEVRIQEAHADRLRARWADPLAEQPARGRWIDPRAVHIRRRHP
ncbi:hypothetical protein ILP97_39855 [Amycolatopsis sp. H6(2020)]|nr:hypothetical protein [Amycolatopsis sp. H6(2020)]